MKPIRCNVHALDKPCQNLDATGVGIGWLEVVLGGTSLRVCPWHRAVGTRLDLRPVAEPLAKGLDTRSGAAMVPQSLRGSVVAPAARRKKRAGKP